MGLAQFQYCYLLSIFYDVDDIVFGHSCSSSSNDCANSINDGCWMPNDCANAVHSDRASVGISISCFEGERSEGVCDVVAWACWAAYCGLLWPRNHKLAKKISNSNVGCHRGGTKTQSIVTSPMPT